MTYVITSPCTDVKDRSCVNVCPVDCIHDSGAQMVIDPVECIDCGACVPECPVEAIFFEADVPDGERESVARAESFFDQGTG